MGKHHSIQPFVICDGKNLTRKLWVVTAIAALTIVFALVIRNQVKVYRARQAATAIIDYRGNLFAALQSVALTNCQLERFGEKHDGGYLMCANLLDAVAAGYSYGISGYDQWGCDISTKRGVPLHQYDCFDTTQPLCATGKTIFHAECIGDTRKVEDGRIFDTLSNQLAKNGDTGKRLVLKMDVEGAEWESLLSAPEEILRQIDQMAVEFHWGRDQTERWIHDEKQLRVIQRLKQYFEIAHLHFNNASCVAGLEPFPSWAYEVLFVNKRLAIADRTRPAGGLHPLDAPNNPSFADCQPTAR